MPRHPIDISLLVPEHRFRVMAANCERLRVALGVSQFQAFRRCTIALLKSLRARTKAARKNLQMKAFAKYTGPGPHYITPTRGNYIGTPLHRWTKAGYRRDLPHTFIYAAESKRDAWQRHRQIRRYGLAKASWGWFMKSLFNQSQGENGGRLAIDSRMVEKKASKVAGRDGANYALTIINKLDYINAALSEADIDAAMSAANDNLHWQIKHAAEKAAERMNRQ